MAKTNGMSGDFSFYPPKWAAPLDLVTPLWILWFSCIFCVCVYCVLFINVRNYVVLRPTDWIMSFTSSGFGLGLPCSWIRMLCPRL